MVCKISNSNMWTSKHLAQAFCTELTLNWEKNQWSLSLNNFLKIQTSICMTPMYHFCMMSFSLKRTGARLLTNKDDITFNIISWKMEFFAGIWHYGHELNWKKFLFKNIRNENEFNWWSSYILRRPQNFAKSSPDCTYVL